MTNFEDLMWLFSSNNHSRGICRLNIGEAALLYQYAKKVKDSVILEIGRKFAGSTVIMASALDSGVIYSIDIVNHKQAIDNVAPFGDKVVLIESDSRKAKWDKPIGLVFIDGDHNPKVVKSDIERFTPFVVQGGYAALHDTTKVPIDKLMNWMMKNGWKKEIRVDTLMVLRKK